MTRALHTLVRLLAVAAIAYAMACGGDIAGGSSCSLSLVVSPDQPVRGDTVEVAADVLIDGMLSGVETIDWSIRFDGAEVSFDVTGANGDEVVFSAAEAGVYNIAVSGSLGGTACTSDARDLNVNQEGAIVQPMRLVIVPKSSSVLPPQTIDFELPGGADYSLSTLSLQGGELSAVVVQGPDSEPLPGAYLRAIPLGAGPELWVERFSQADGEVNLRLLAGTLDLLVVPDAADLPALLVDNVLPADLTGPLAVDDGIEVTGTVSDPGGDPVAGARVQLTVGGAPSTIGTTGGGGAFSLRARAGGPVEVTVTPPDASGLPALQVSGGAAIADDSALDIEYDAGLDVRTVSPVLRETDGSTPAAGARVTFIANPIDGAGTITLDGADLSAEGVLVRTAQANGAGVIPDQVVTATRYDVIVEPGPGAPAGEAVHFHELDLRTGQDAPASLRLAAPGHLTGTVVDAAGAPVEGARVAAAPTGLLARATAAGGAGTTGADGSFDLRVAAGGRYQVRVDGPGSAGRVLLAADESDGALSAALPPTLRLGGELTIAGGNRVEGALIQLQCLTCGPGGGPATVAEAVSDASGAFSMLAPDPGVAE